ncbi:NADPH-dependent 7-cyano-7-deazaguanine reductase QueF [Thauera mechernichensis]|uniref:NADPH-dependent 7-cyano-7-deazaguanine reductase n=1 Tax=Thauera mechernichensis TaxID=82788 RepID=A0ABW3WB37_9RHOO|nr:MULTISPECIES: NADPH-dependent 7-cyano-7-deazaguanine reductase QueF [Thauera]HAY08670.1 NADPH-dependent 7-cyano-7-deazaguanine reductase QueF [Thauera sp.]ENO80734.1 7-cyano-7-deazaguanine reductase [Thauera sp. 27]ENO92021.1 7-cyano-7-deazaguanine reductase [Thauera sp. 28]MDG3065834.1 NADPH-dependent 7-cyano-7-deazaguanine reductase QueF [Thauera mechernichensis]WBL64855.1 NADPH-dependent 7-cyano-7-deazaguanine reductase QueF [Thauera sp. WB-2]
MTEPTPTPAHGAEASPLGRPVAYRDTYAPELLFPIERQLKRAELGIAVGALPFFGEDSWNAYELSWLDPRGKPVVALGGFRVPADSPRLIESKSLKLYLNAFNQQRCASLEEVTQTIARDLSAAAGATVAVSVVPLSARPQRHSAYPEGHCLDELDIGIDRYQPDPGLLSAAGEEVAETLYSHLLKSNCLVTGQPDWGTLVVRYRGPAIDREGLLRYIVSFRDHNEFHEQCVERVFCDLMARCRPCELAVWARYTRRGGLDINPFRASHAHLRADEAMEVRQ